jgi:hypothetical protein
MLSCQTARMEMSPIQVDTSTTADLAEGSIVTDEEYLHLHRSKAVDAFACAEATIFDWLRRLKLTVKREPLQTKIARLKDAEAGPQLSRKRRVTLHEELGELLDLLPYRNDLVHAPLSVRHNGKELVAGFYNPHDADAHEFMRLPHEFAQSDLESLTRKVRVLAKKLAER